VGYVREPFRERDLAKTITIRPDNTMVAAFGSGKSSGTRVATISYKKKLLP